MQNQVRRKIIGLGREISHVLLVVILKTFQNFQKKCLSFEKNWFESFEIGSIEQSSPLSREGGIVK